MDTNELFPHIKHSVENFLFDEEGNIPRNKILAIGSMMLILSMILGEDAFAAHRTHYSHRSHSSHRSSSGHSNHGSHSTHSNHATYSDHANHSTSSVPSRSYSAPSHSTHTTHNNAAPSIESLKIPRPSEASIIPETTINDIGTSLNAALPSGTITVPDNINSFLEEKVETPPDTPSV